MAEVMAGMVIGFLVGIAFDRLILQPVIDSWRVLARRGA